MRTISQLKAKHCKLHSLSFASLPRTIGELPAAVVKLVYTLVSGTSGSNPVEVRLLSAAPLLVTNNML